MLHPTFPRLQVHLRQIPAGLFLLKRKSRRDRMRAKIQEVKKELRRRMHQPIPEQGKWLRQVVTGYFAYHAVPTNGHALMAFRFHIANLWRRTLKKRSQKDQTTWDRITKLTDDWLPNPRILHPWPRQRYARTLVIDCAEPARGLRGRDR
jgi:RNA-directed DNA polymerase